MELSKNGIQSQYKRKMREYISRIPDQNFIFEITKCCGYSEILCINKNETFASLQRNIFFQFGKKYTLYAVNNQTNEKINIPDSNDILIRNFIFDNRDFFIPIYSLPDEVVYRLYFHDSCNHKIDEGQRIEEKENENEYVDFSHSNVYFT
jgi:hypothetical protein